MRSGFKHIADSDRGAVRSAIVRRRALGLLLAGTSTASSNTDQGADPNRLVSITDLLSATSAPGGESFSVLQTAGFGQVLRGVALAPVPEPGTWALMLVGFGGLGAGLRSSRRRQRGALAA